MNIDIIINSQEKYDKTISYYERALNIYNREFEVNHIHLIITIMNIDNVYNSQGKYDEAISH